MNVLRIAGAALCVTLLSGCTNDVTLTNPSPGVPGNFIQIETQGRNLAINLFTPWSDHVAINQADIGPGGTIISNDIKTFMTAAKRSAAITSQVQVLLTPSVLYADLSQTSNASFLGIETNKQLNVNGTVCGSGAPNSTPCTGGLFGGRGLTDDVGATMLGLAYGPLIPELFPTIPDDHQEQTNMPDLANDNVPYPGNTTIVQFPYLAPPH